MKNFIRTLERLLIIPGTFDPDDLRRRRVLDLVLTIVLLTIVIFLLVVGWDETGKTIAIQIMTDPDTGLLIPIFLMTGLTMILLGLNRYNRTPANLVGWIFILGVVFFVSMADYPQELTRGRSIFAWAIPIALSVVTLPPAAVFVVDFFITILFMYWAGFQYETFQVYTIMQIYLVSVVSWLGMSIAERAIRARAQ